MSTKKPTAVELLMKQVGALTQQLAELKQQQATTASSRSARKVAKGQPRPDVYYVLTGVPSHGVPPQAMVCARILATAKDASHITEEEAMKLIEDAKASGRLRTTQEAWHIFQYYRPRLIEGNFLRMISNGQ